MIKPLTSVCIYCGSSGRVDASFKESAQAMGRSLAQAGITLVYGGGHVGLMGLCANAALEAGGSVVGVIPEHLHRIEVAHQGLTELHIVPNMHVRKMLMFERSDAFVAMPGGIGTLDELCEIITWRQLGMHDKPILIVNQDGYWDPFLALVDHVIDKAFANASVRALYSVVPDVASVLPALRDAPQPARPPQMERL